MTLLKTKVVAKTVPCIEGIDTLEDFVAYTARVSNPDNQMNTLTGTKLLNYLIDHWHWSPFEMANMVIEVESTRDITRQLLRHRSFSFQEFSQRYADTTALNITFDDVERECRMQDTKNRQNSIPCDNKVLSDFFTFTQREIFDLAVNTYSDALASNIAKEQARALLPEGLTPSRLYVNGNLRSWIHYVALRSGNGTQKEHIDLAKACAKVISEAGFPLIERFVEE